MLKRLSVTLLVLVALVAAMAQTATAAEPAPQGFEGSFALRGTHGYGLFGLIASTGKGGILFLSVAKKGEAATYLAHGKVTTESVDFDLGALGTIDVAVEPNGKSETLNSKCGGGGKSTTVPADDYVGTIEFHGEEGFTEVTTTRTPLLLGAALNLICGSSGSGESFGQGIPGVRIKARRSRGPYLQLNQNHPGAPVLFGAGIEEQEGAVKVKRAVGGRLGAGALDYAPALGSATFTGAGPFDGQATYVEARPPRGTRPGQGAWRGDLKVDFPGASGVRLAGPGFKAGIIHAHHFPFHE
jgi:hypothetical protein